MRVTYSLICENDIHKEITLHDILHNERIAKLIKSEFAKGIRNLDITATSDATVILATHKEQFELEVDKNDFADLIELAEEDARKNKRLKKGCEGIELVDFVTLDS